MILAGDIGGTSTRLGLFEGGAGSGLRTVAIERYAGRDYPGLREIVDAFRASYPDSIDAAAFGIAGPVRDGRVQTPNLPWVIERRALAEQLGVARVELLNDLEANAWGVFTLGATDVETLAAGAPTGDGNAAIIAAGTGLGEAGYHWDGRQLVPFASEGGHADYAPHDELTIELYRWLAKRFGHVSWERVVSGPGLVNLYTFLRENGSGSEPPLDDAAAISKADAEGTNALAAKAMDLFVVLYGAEAGNLALKMKATQGLWIGGGIAPRILPRMKRPEFLQAFHDKGRFRGFLENVPVRLILNDKTALRGAAWRALSSTA